MKNAADRNSANNPAWINPMEYPFKPHYFKCSAGTMHYIDEGQGKPIIMVHGNPDWSFFYRNLVKTLSKHYRCIAIDHIGFGLSDKPLDWTYLPEEHAKNFSDFITYLDLKDMTLVVNDWGGPIALCYAVDHAERVDSIVILNTWAWPVNDDWYYQGFSKFMGGPIGRFLVLRFNFFAKVVLKAGYADKTRLTKEIHEHYLKPLEQPKERKGNWIFPKRIIDSGEWLRILWSKIDKISNKPTLILWGLKDIAFREKELKRWVATMSRNEVHTFSDAGHYPQEEKSLEVAKLIEEFLKRIQRQLNS
jgi:haloalkane dehalogenase